MKVLRTTSLPDQRGLSLIELMISMVIGLVVLLVLASIFISTMNTRGELEKTNRQIENGRYAMQIITEDLANAGFVLGGNLPAAGTPPSICSTTLDLNALSYYLFGAEGVTSDLACTSNIAEGTDVLVVRRASTCAVGETGCAAFEAGHPHLQVHACQTPAGSVLAGDALVGTTAAAMVGLARNCTTAAPIHRLITHVYYIGIKDGDIPVLMRAELSGNRFVAAELAEGIEKLHFEYGIDSTGNDGAADVYKTLPESNTEWRQTVAVKVHLLARNLDKTNDYVNNRTYVLGAVEYSDLDGDPEDKRGYKRQAYSATVRLNNPAGRLE